MTIAIADAGDHILDSGVFIQGSQFRRPTQSCARTGDNASYGHWPGWSAWSEKEKKS